MHGYSMPMAEVLFGSITRLNTHLKRVSLKRLERIILPISSNTSNLGYSALRPAEWDGSEPMTLDEESFRKSVVKALLLIFLTIVAVLIYNYIDVIRFCETKIGAFLIYVCLCLLIYAHFEPFRLHFTYHTIKIHKKFKSFTAVQLTDIHLQWPYPYITEEKLSKIVSDVNALNPDFIFLTGDYISRWRSFSISKKNTESFVKGLAGLKATRGIYGILGNNDFCAQSMVIDALSRLNVRLLRGECVVDGDVSISGIDSCKRIEIAQKRLGSLNVSDAGIKILLAHEPDIASISHPSFDLQLSGHTHGGQCVAPLGIGPIISPTMGKMFPLGLYKVYNMILYVSSGVGISPLPKPLVRFNNRPEVAVLRVVSDIGEEDGTAGKEF